MGRWVIQGQRFSAGRSSLLAGQGLQVVPLELTLTRKTSLQAQFRNYRQPKARNLPSTVPEMVWCHWAGWFGTRGWRWLQRRTSYGILLHAGTGLVLTAPQCFFEQPELWSLLKCGLSLRKPSSPAMYLCQGPALGWWGVQTKWDLKSPPQQLNLSPCFAWTSLLLLSIWPAWCPSICGGFVTALSKIWKPRAILEHSSLCLIHVF